MATTSTTTRKRTKKEPAPGDALQAIREWTDRHGRLPSEDEHPLAPAAIRKFGSWKGALAAAGFPLEPGHRPGPGPRRG